MIRLRPERLVAGGDALARLEDGRIAFVPGALPGDEIDASIVEDKGDFVRAEIVELIDPSPDRVAPVCPHRTAGCGGCGWMHLAAPAQLDAKAEIVAESLRRIGRFDDAQIDDLVMVGGSVAPTSYRTSIRVIGTGDGVAYREERTDRPTPIDDCLVAHPMLSQLLGMVQVAPRVELSLRTSVSTGGSTALWKSPEQRAPRRGQRRTQAAAEAAHVAGSQRPVEGLPRGVHIGERAHLTERIDGVDLRVSAPSFFQSGPAAATMLVDAVNAAAPELAGARHAVDAYGGVGLFAATTMRSARRVTLVESARSSTHDATHNLKSRGDSVTIVRSEMATWVPESDDIDVVVADPARSGLAKPGVAAITGTNAPTLVLVSCDPVSLARDARMLAEAGYRPERVEVLDLFPQTPHVETVTRFTR